MQRWASGWSYEYSFLLIFLLHIFPTHMNALPFTRAVWHCHNGGTKKLSWSKWILFGFVFIIFSNKNSFVSYMRQVKSWQRNQLEGHNRTFQKEMLSALLLKCKVNHAIFLIYLLLTKICNFFVWEVPAGRKTEMVATINGDDDKERVG